MIQKTFSTITTEIAKEQIWKLMSNINDWKTFDETVEYSELQGEFKAGSSFILKPKGGPKVKIILMDVQPPHYFKDKTTFPLAQMYGEHWYEDTQLGLKITVTMTMAGLLSALWNKLVMKNIVEHLEDDITLQIAAAKKI
jgi:hypothetical protein